MPEKAHEGSAMVRSETGRRSTSAQIVSGGLGLASAVSLAAAVLMAFGSIVGLAHPEVYPVGARASFVPNDAVNLVLGVPVLLAVTWWGQRGSLLATLAWPGALGYVTYNYTAYLVGLPVGPLRALVLVLVALSGIGVWAVLGRLDRPAARDMLSGVVPIRIGGWAVLVFGVVFAGRAASALTDAGTLPSSEVGVLVADLVASVAWGVAGIAMVRRVPAGYAAGLGALVSVNLLFAGLVLLLLLQPALTGRGLALGDLVTVAAMWPLTLLPGVLFARGVASRGRGAVGTPGGAIRGGDVPPRQLRGTTPGAGPGRS